MLTKNNIPDLVNIKEKTLFLSLYYMNSLFFFVFSRKDIHAEKNINTDVPWISNRIYR